MAISFEKIINPLTFAKETNFGNFLTINIDVGFI